MQWSVSGGLLSQSYQYDGRGNVTQMTYGSGLSNSFTYDHRDRLTSVSPSGADAGHDALYFYDTIGNLTFKLEGQANGVSEVWTPGYCGNAVDDDGDRRIDDGCGPQYTSLAYDCGACSPKRPHAIKTASGTNYSFPFDPYFISNYTYDAAGNLLNISANDPELGLLLRLEFNDQDGVVEAGEGYDAEGRLHKIGYNKLDFGSDFAFYDVNDDCVVNYDDLGLMYTAYDLNVYQQGYNPRFDLNSDGVINSVDTDAATGQLDKTCPRFIYDADGNLMVLEGPKRMVYIGGIYEKNVETGEVTKYYHTANGRRLAMRKGSRLSYFANDHLGSTSVVMDSAGAKVSETRYYPYGNVWTQTISATPPTDKLFTGQRRFGQRSGIYHYGSRLYNADIGRFIQADSIVPGAENPQALNRYSYVLNNPLRYTDPTGNIPLDDEGTNAAPAPEGGWNSGWPAIVEEAEETVGDIHPALYLGGQEETQRWIRATYRAARVLQRVRPLDSYAWSYDQLFLLRDLSFEVTIEPFPPPGSLGAESFYLAIASSLVVGGGGGGRVPASAWFKATGPGGTINITSEGLRHTFERHVVTGHASANPNKSLFLPGRDVVTLIKEATGVSPITQRNGNLAWTVDAGKGNWVGIDRNTRGLTTRYTVITKPNGDLKTAFPGDP